eukprot:13932294-Heterocapsa_arctica.AAC.1
MAWRGSRAMGDGSRSMAWQQFNGRWQQSDGMEGQPIEGMEGQQMSETDEANYDVDHEAAAFMHDE